MVDALSENAQSLKVRPPSLLRFTRKDFRVAKHPSLVDTACRPLKSLPLSVACAKSMVLLLRQVMQNVTNAIQKDLKSLRRLIREHQQRCLHLPLRGLQPKLRSFDARSSKKVNHAVILVVRDDCKIGRSVEPCTSIGESMYLFPLAGGSDRDPRGGPQRRPG